MPTENRVNRQYKKGTEVPRNNYFCIAMYKQLSREQRYAIYLGIQEGKSQKAIARQNNIHPSTVSREVRRNSTKHGVYQWQYAQKLADERRERLPGKHVVRPEVMREALRLLVSEDWSPKQISGWLSLKGMDISHETIYRRIRSDVSGELSAHCRHRMKYRHHVKRPRTTKVRNIPGRVSIHERPPEANGKRFGDWEMDLIVGKGQKGAILTLCERSVNYMMMGRLPQGKKPEAVAETVIRMLMPFKEHVLTITTDNGGEFRCHRKIAKRLKTTVYFADSYASWQKGAIENTNKLIRQYIPKGTDFTLLTDEFIRNVQYKINRRPREKLNFHTPKERFFKLLL